MSYPQIFFDIMVGRVTLGRVVMELYTDSTPLTAENCRDLCTGEYGIGSSGKQLHYKYSLIHLVMPGLMCQGGDFDGKGGESTYGKEFNVEDFTRKDTDPGILSMVTNNVNGTNGSRFCICFKKAPELDGKQWVFGKVVSGMEVSIKEVQKRGEEMPIAISDCGQFKRGRLGLDSAIYW